MTFQREQSADELNERQKLKQTFTKKFENRKNTFQSNDEDVATLSNDNIDYVKFVAKKKKNEKSENLKKNILCYKRKIDDCENFYKMMK